MSTSSAEEKHFLRYGAMNHWRGLAALMVVAYHTFWALALKGPLSGPAEAVRWVSSAGYLGVHLFFVISGYCIAANVHHSALGGRSALDFLRDRFLRIYPPYWAAFLCQIGLMLLVAPFSSASDRLPLPGSAWILTTNLLLIEPYAGTPQGMVVTWTLVYEFSFYLLVTAGFALSKHLGNFRHWAWVAIALAALGFLKLPQPAFRVLNYWPEFVFGGLVYLARLEEVRKRPFARNIWLLAIAALFTAGWCCSHLDHLRHLPYATAFGLLLYFLAPLDRVICKARWLHWLGLAGAFSYSLYLIHVPILLRASNLGRRLVHPQSNSVLLVILVIWLLTVFAGYLFYRFCEIPLERVRFHLRHRPPAVALPSAAISPRAL